MRFKVIATDHGKHSDMKLAVNCAQDLVEDSAKISGQDAIEMRKLENQLVDILEGHFKSIADREMGGLSSKGHDWLGEPLEGPSDMVAAMCKAVKDAYAASPFGGDPNAMWPDPAGPEGAMIRRGDLMDRTIVRVVSKFVRDAQHMHRDWFAGFGMVGHHTALTKDPRHDPSNEHVVRWFDLHQAQTPEHFRRALHEILSGERLPAA